MRISHRHRLIFFAFPKAGSSTIRRFLDPWTDLFPVKHFGLRTAENPFYPHMTPREARPLFHSRGWDFDAYRRFAVVRNPWARLVSLYRHLAATRADPAPFREWLQTVEPQGTGGGGPANARWLVIGGWTMHHFIADADGTPMVDRVLRLEDLHGELKPYLRELGLPNVEDSPLTHRNQRGEPGDYVGWYDDESADRVGLKYQSDITRWDYAFGN